MSAAEIIYEGLAAPAGELDAVRAVHGATRALRPPPDNPLYRFKDLGAGRRRAGPDFWSSVDGRKTLAGLRTLDILAPQDVDDLIFALRCAGMVELKGKAIWIPPPISFQEVGEIRRSGAHAALPPPLPKGQVPPAVPPPLRTAHPPKLPPKKKGKSGVPDVWSVLAAIPEAEESRASTTAPTCCRTRPVQGHPRRSWSCRGGTAWAPATST